MLFRSKRLSEQVNLIMHHGDFQKLEGAWRGLHYLVNNTETDEMLKIRVMNVSKAELHKTLKRYKGTAWDQSPIFKRIYEEEYGQLGGHPYGCLVGDYTFDHSPPDVVQGNEEMSPSGTPYEPSEQTAMLTQSPAGVPSAQSRTWLSAALAADAALEAPRASMIAAPRC